MFHRLRASSVFRTLVIAIGLGLAACTTPYSPPRFESEQADGARFHGVLDLLERYGALHILWLHGMCPHTKEDWADVRVTELAKRLGIGVESGVKSAALGSFVYRYELRYKGNPITLDMVVWSELIRKRREAMCFDSRPAQEKDGIVWLACGDKANYPYPRAKLNDALKSGLMNACLADAIIYTGAQGATVRDRIRPEVERALTEPGASSSGAVLLVSESLGSKVLIDVLHEIMAKKDIRAKRAIETLARTQQVAMFANQIPILDLVEPERTTEKRLKPSGETDVTTDTTLRSFIRELRSQQREKALPSIDRLSVVAYTDPNDVLSYRLPKGYFPKELKTDVVNVIVSNSSVWFGLFENPDSAHRGYGATDDVMALFLCGKPQQLTDCPVKARR